MKNGVTSNHWDQANPTRTGGYSFADGLAIAWRNTPLENCTTSNRAHGQQGEGACVEDVILAALERLEFFQRGKHECCEHDLAINFLRNALETLNDRKSAVVTRDHVQSLHLE